MILKQPFKNFLLVIILLAITGLFISYRLFITVQKQPAQKPALTQQECPLVSTHPSFVGNKKLAFQSVTKTTSLQALIIEGSLPTWLKGMLIATGPAQFELGPTKASYWFNGLALLHGFYFDGTSATYQSSFLDSIYYRRCMKNGRFDSSMSTEKPQGFFSRLAAAALSTPEPYDNGNLALTEINNKIIALTETTQAVQIDPVTLKTVASFNIDDQIDGHLTTINFQYDPATQRYYNYLINFGTTSNYVIYSLDKNSIAQTLSTIPVKTPSYMRSMAMTKNYLVLIEIPFVVNPMDLLLGAGAFIEKVQWKPELGTNCTVIDKRTGAIVSTLHTDTPLLVFNTINAFEKNNEIIIDCIAYNNASIFPYTKIEALRSDNEHEFEPSYYTRLKLDMGSSTVLHKRYCKITLASPTFNKKYRMDPYRFVYGTGSQDPYKLPHALVKINTQNGELLHWQEQGCYANEPTFIPAPEAQSEDDGILASLVFDSVTQRSFLLLLNALTLQEVARAYLPQAVPFGVAGIFINNELLSKAPST